MKHPHLDQRLYRNPIPRKNTSKLPVLLTAFMLLIFGALLALYVLNQPLKISLHASGTIKTMSTVPTGCGMANLTLVGYEKPWYFDPEDIPGVWQAYTQRQKVNVTYVPQEKCNGTITRLTFDREEL